MNHPILRSFPAVVAAIWLGSLPAHAAIPNYDFQWATIGAVNNPAYDRPEVSGNGFPTGRGSVGYEYRMSKYEVTAGQWLEFVNTFAPLGDPYGFGNGSTGGGIERGIGQPLHWVLGGGPDAANVPMSRLSWRAAAMYCNWLHNDKAPTIDALLTGAYDTSTWGQNPPGEFPLFTDAATHLPGAKFWIPTTDEWIKAVHYDPKKNDGQGGYWLYPDSSDTEPASGNSPLIGGNGETNAGFADFNPASWRTYRVGAFPDVQTPWGLFDASGGVSEWQEDWQGQSQFVTNRRWDGESNGFITVISGDADHVTAIGSDRPTTYVGNVGLRLASAVPGTSATTALIIGVSTYFIRRRRAPACG